MWCSTVGLGDSRLTRQMSSWEPCGLWTLITATMLIMAAETAGTSSTTPPMTTLTRTTSSITTSTSTTRLRCNDLVDPPFCGMLACGDIGVAETCPAKCGCSSSTTTSTSATMTMTAAPADEPFISAQQSRFIAIAIPACVITAVLAFLCATRCKLDQKAGPYLDRLDRACGLLPCCRLRICPCWDDECLRGSSRCCCDIQETGCCGPGPFCEWRCCGFGCGTCYSSGSPDGLFTASNHLDRERKLRFSVMGGAQQTRTGVVQGTPVLFLDRSETNHRKAQVTNASGPGINGTGSNGFGGVHIAGEHFGGFDDESSKNGVNRFNLPNLESGQPGQSGYVSERYGEPSQNNRKGKLSRKGKRDLSQHILTTPQGTKIALPNGKLENGGDEYKNPEAMYKGAHVAGDYILSTVTADEGQGDRPSIDTGDKMTVSRRGRRSGAPTFSDCSDGVTSLRKKKISKKHAQDGGGTLEISVGGGAEWISSLPSESHLQRDARSGSLHDNVQTEALSREAHIVGDITTPFSAAAYLEVGSAIGSSAVNAPPIIDRPPSPDGSEVKFSDATRYSARDKTNNAEGEKWQAGTETVFFISNSQENQIGDALVAPSAASTATNSLSERQSGATTQTVQVQDEGSGIVLAGADPIVTDDSVIPFDRPGGQSVSSGGVVNPVYDDATNGDVEDTAM